jgi:hypothetical protein
LFFDTTVTTCASKPSNALSLCYQLITSLPLGVHGVTTPLVCGLLIELAYMGKNTCLICS